MDKFSPNTPQIYIKLHALLCFKLFDLILLFYTLCSPNKEKGDENTESKEMEMAASSHLGGGSWNDHWLHLRPAVI